MRRGRSRDPRGTAFWSRYGVSIGFRLLPRFSELRISRLSPPHNSRPAPRKGEKGLLPRFTLGPTLGHTPPSLFLCVGGAYALCAYSSKQPLPGGGRLFTGWLRAPSRKKSKE